MNWNAMCNIFINIKLTKWTLLCQKSFWETMIKWLLWVLYIAVGVNEVTQTWSDSSLCNKHPVGLHISKFDLKSRHVTSPHTVLTRLHSWIFQKKIKSVTCSVFIYGLTVPLSCRHIMSVHTSPVDWWLTMTMASSSEMGRTSSPHSVTARQDEGKLRAEQKWENRLRLKWPHCFLLVIL